MRIYFVRHGESEANANKIISNKNSNYSLTRKGIQQVKSLCRKFKKIEFHIIYSSPIQRATETSKILSQALYIPVEIRDCIQEFDAGILEGLADEKSWNELGDLWQNWFVHNNPDYKIQDGESLNDIKNRFSPFIFQIVKDYHKTDNNIIIVGHCGSFICTLPFILHNIDMEYAYQRWLGNCEFVLAEYIKGNLNCVQWGAYKLINS